MYLFETKYRKINQKIYFFTFYNKIKETKNKYEIFIFDF